MAVDYNKNKHTINGVIAMAADVPLTVAHVATKLGLTAPDIKTASLSMNKLAMKQKFLKENIAVPWFKQVKNPKDIYTALKERSEKLVVKPVDSRGARGVSLAWHNSNLEKIFNDAIAVSPSSTVMVEEFIEGPQISTETLVVNGKCHTPGFVDRNYEHLEKFFPNIIEDGGQQPTLLSIKQKDTVTALAEQAALVMGIKNGVAKGDMVLSRNGPVVIETAARLSGGWLSSHQIPLGTGVDFIKAAILIALGEKPDPKDIVPQFTKGTAIRYFFAHPGKVKAILNADKIAALPWVAEFKLFINPGDTVLPVTNHTARSGFVLTTGKDRAEAVKRAQMAVSEIDIITE
jgi:biotin carboxylase